MRRRSFLSRLPAVGVALSVRPALALGTGEGANAVSAYGWRLLARVADGGGGSEDPAAPAELLRLHNALRAHSGLPPLEADPELARAARAHAGDLIARAYFAHAAPEGFTSRERVALLARRFIGAAGENLAAEDGDAVPGPDRFLALWRASPPHLENILRGRYTHAGFAVLRRGRGSVAVAVFGQRYGQLRGPAPLSTSRRGLPELLRAASAPLAGYRLERPQGGEEIGPFALDEAPRSASGPFLLRPEAVNPQDPRSILLMYGPILQLL